MEDILILKFPFFGRNIQNKFIMYLQYILCLFNIIQQSHVLIGVFC